MRFYGEVLGLPLRGRGRADGPELSTLIGLDGVVLEWAELRLGDGQVLELLRYVAPEGRRSSSGRATPGAATSRSGSMRSTRCTKRMRSAGFHPRSAPVTIEPGDWFGCRCLYVSDPDGFTVELLERPVVRA
ncbi:MAG: hypothetical protein U0V56_11690 [Actinomycetota bacterium]